MRVLVTGAGGYLGSVLVARLLASGVEVDALDNGCRRASGLLNLFGHERLAVHIGDVRDSRLVDRLCHNIDSVIHLAALVGQPTCELFPTEAESVNVGGTQVLVNALDKDTLLIYMSTASVYGAASGDYCDEDTVPRPASVYAKTKFASEPIALSHGNAIVVRPVTMFGVSGSMRADLLPHAMCADALWSGSVSVQQGDMVRSFIHVNDVAAAVTRLATSYCAAVGRPPEVPIVRNLCNPSLHMTKRSLGALIAEFIGSACHEEDGHQDIDVRNYRVITARDSLSISGLTGMRQSLEGIVRALKLTDDPSIPRYYK